MNAAGKAFDVGPSDPKSTPVVDVSSSARLPSSVGDTVRGSSSGSGSSGSSSDGASNPDLTQATGVVNETFLIAHLAIAEEGPVSELWRDARAYNDGKFPREARQAGRDKEMANLKLFDAVEEATADEAYAPSSLPPPPPLPHLSQTPTFY